MDKMKKLGIIGIGNWGKNLIRDISKISCVKKCSSLGNPKNISWLKKKYPSIQHTCNLKEIFDDKEIDAVIIATPINTHYNLVKKALLSKKHVFVEKPISSTLSKAEELIKIAKKNNLKVIEDCAQAQGAKFNNKYVGSFGDLGCFSFYPTKILGGYGNGGFISTNSSKLFQKVRRMRFYGIELFDKKNKFNKKYNPQSKKRKSNFGPKKLVNY